MENVHKPSTSIKHWMTEDRPREKLIQSGSQALTSVELIAILIGSGTRELSAIDLARELLQCAENDLNQLARKTAHELQQVKGIGPSKAVTICAAIELGRRRAGNGIVGKGRITSSKDISEYLKHQLRDLGHEVFVVVLLNRANRVIHIETISQGGITGTIADPRIILRTAINHSATGMIICHNHPSGNLWPSDADKMLTEKINEACMLVDIKLLDHLIVSSEGYFSFADEGLM
jgi:DNA repair protein RadC